jgi:hypothetical protein
VSAGRVELVNPDGAVVAWGKVGQWMQVEGTAVALTACADLGDELLLVPLGAGPARVLQFGANSQLAWPDPPQ